MPAPDIATLIEADAAVAEAWLGVLKAAGLNCFAEFSDEEKQTPYVEVQLEQSVPTTHRYNHTIAGRTLQYQDAWKGTLVSRVVTVRGKNSDQQRPLTRAIRAVGQQDRVIFNRANLPFHGVNSFVESGVVRTISEEQRLDLTEIRHSIHFGIRGDAWPVEAVPDYLLDSIVAGYRFRAGLQLWNPDQNLFFAVTPRQTTAIVGGQSLNLTVLAIADEGAADDGAPAAPLPRFVRESHRIKADGTLQLYNPDTGFYHAVTLRGALGAETLGLDSIGEPEATEPGDGGFALKSVSANYRFQESGAVQLWNPESNLFFGLQVRGSHGAETIAIAQFGEA